MSKKCTKTRLRASLISIFFGTPDPVKGEGRGGEEKKGSGEEGGEGKGCVMAVGGWVPLLIRFSLRLSIEPAVNWTLRWQTSSLTTCWLMPKFH